MQALRWKVFVILFTFVSLCVEQGLALTASNVKQGMNRRKDTRHVQRLRRGRLWEQGGVAESWGHSVKSSGGGSREDSKAQTKGSGMPHQGLEDDRWPWQGVKWEVRSSYLSLGQSSWLSRGRTSGTEKLARQLWNESGKEEWAPGPGWAVQGKGCPW